MPLTKVSFSVIQVANNVTSTTVGNTTSIPSFTFDQNGVITSASNTAISGAGITANTVANSAFQTGSVENYLRGANLDFGMRNRIINGAMVIDQRNAGASITPLTSGSWYATDRFQLTVTQSSKFTSQQSSTAPTGFNNSVLITSSSAYSVTSTDAFILRQIVEGYNFADCNWGTANAKTVTLSFWVQSSLTGTFGGSLANSDSSRSYPFTYTISSANTWEQKTITITGDTTGTWGGATNGRGVIVNFGLGIGSTYLGTAGAWAGANYISATGATSVVGTNGATFYITGVQLEEGSVPTSFEYRQYGTELTLCQRYFQRLNSSGNRDFNGYVYNASLIVAQAQLPVPMRIAPTTLTTSGTAGDYTIFNAATNTNMSAVPAMNSSSPNFASLTAIPSSSLTTGQAIALAGNNTNAFYAFSAEL